MEHARADALSSSGPAGPAPSRPTSSYRLQLHAGFTLHDAAKIVPFLKRLGVGAVYLSPVTAAAPGSRHGYDVCDPTRLNPELGGADALRDLVEALARAGMGCILDIVPNHMSADPVNNPWWRDVLRRGPQSSYADYFDIDWRPRKQGLHNKVLLPVLEDAYGVTLEKGELTLVQSPEGLAVRYRDVTYPLDPDTLRTADAPHVDRAPEATASSDADGNAEADALHALLERQSYRLANWRTALHEANYRRFFDVSTLLGIRMERPEVFEDAHRLVRDVLRLLARAGVPAGVRVDHVDGLKDPEEYLRNLRRLLDEATGGHTSLVVEKILQGDERLPATWPVDGTSGYDFLGELERLFTDPGGLETLRGVYGRWVSATDSPAAGERDRADEEGRARAVAGKRAALSLLLRSELNALADMLDRLSETHRDFRDFTRDDIFLLLGETIAHMRVYRTYGREGSFSDTDRRALDQALEEATRHRPDVPPGLARFLRTVFLAFDPSHDVSPLSRAACREFAARMQQVMGAAHAKGVEDTAFYRDATLLSLHEVGLWPGCAPLTPDAFHDAMTRRARTAPASMLATSTHDTKRGEDVRARLAVLSETPASWEGAVTALRADPRFHGTAPAAAGGAPRNADQDLSPDASPDPSEGVSGHDDFLLLQTLTGCWPLDPETGTPAPVDDVFRERIRDALRKAAREAKRRTAWIRPDEHYEAALEARVEHLLRGPGLDAVREHLFPVITACARRGMRASLARLACKLAAPGFPDLYQGTEGWDLSLVDPDNRRDVDFATNETRLDALEPLLALINEPGAPRDEIRTRLRTLLTHAANGDVKRFVTARGLRWRAAHPALFLEGTYVPVACVYAENAREGAGSAARGETPAPLARACPHVLAFRRDHEGRSLLVVFPIRTRGDEAERTEHAEHTEGGERAIPARAGGRPVVVLPPEWEGAPLRHLFTGAVFAPRCAAGAAASTLDIADLLEEFPAAWLWKEHA